MEAADSGSTVVGGGADDPVDDDESRSLVASYNVFGGECIMKHHVAWLIVMALQVSGFRLFLRIRF